MRRRGDGILRLEALEIGGRALRRAGLGRVVDGLGPALGRRAAHQAVEVDGLWLSGDHVGQLYYLRELAQAGRESFFTELLVEAIEPDGLAVDGGAYIGYMTLQLARAAGPGGRVVSFEPNPEAQPVLVRNLSRNGLADRVRVCPKALGAKAGTANLHIVGGGDESAFAPTAAVRRTVTVDVTSLDDELAADPVPDVVKLDLEGAEVAALIGMSRLVDREAESPRIFVECNAAALAAAGTSPSALLGLLDGFGYAVWRVDEADRLLVPATVDDVSGAYVNLVCARGSAAQAYETLAA